MNNHHTLAVPATICLLLLWLALSCAEDECDCLRQERQLSLPGIWSIENASSQEVTVVWCDSCGQVCTALRPGETCRTEVYGRTYYALTSSGHVIAALRWGRNTPDMVLVVGETAIVLCSGPNDDLTQHYVSTWMARNSRKSASPTAAASAGA